MKRRLFLLFYRSQGHQGTPPSPSTSPRHVTWSCGGIRNRNTEVYLYIFVSWPIFVCFDMDTDVDVGSRNRHLGRHVGILTDRGVKVLISVITCTWRFLLNWRNWVYEKKIRQKIRTRAIIWTNQVLSVINQDQVTHHWLIMCTCVVIIKLKKIIKRGKNSRHVE
jgi:hypothetical protein